MNVIFFVAHPDDEAYGPAATIASLAAAGHNVVVISLCKGNRPGAEEVESLRSHAFLKSCSMLGATSIIHNSSDLGLDEQTALTVVESAIKEYKPEVVFTHAFCDLNKDHRTLAEAVLIACRPKPESPVNKLYTFEIPASTEWSFGSRYSEFKPNTFIDATDYIDLKKAVLELYSSEIYQFPDARSIEGMLSMAKSRGKQAGFFAAEAFQLIFSRCRKSI
jgi:LmbE family N-acetylglucosaminyl deacetylase